MNDTPSGTSPERTAELAEQERREKRYKDRTISGGDPETAARMREFGFDPDQPAASYEDYAKMPPPTPHVAPYDSER